MSESFKLIPMEVKAKINPMQPRQSKRPTSNPSQPQINPPPQSRKIFIGAIGTELTSRDLIKAFKAIDVDIVNKPVRILRGKKFNFAPGVEVKTDEQLKKVLAIKRVEVEGSVLEIRPNQPNRKKKVKKEQKQTATEKPIHDTSTERANQLKLKLYELKLMQAENLLMKAKIDSKIRMYQEALQKENIRKFSRSYGEIEQNRMDSISFQSINFDQNLTQAQKEYLKRFQRTRANQKFAQHPPKQIPFIPERSISVRRRKIMELEQRVNDTSQEFYPTSKSILGQVPKHFERRSKIYADMDISGFRPSPSPTDPVLVENMSLENGSFDNVLKGMEAQKMKKISSQILLLVKDGNSEL